MSQWVRHVSHAKSSFNTNWPHLDVWRDVESKQIYHIVNRSMTPQSEKGDAGWDTQIWTCPWPPWAKRWETQSTKALRLDFTRGANTIGQAVKWGKRQNCVLRGQSTLDKSQWAFLQFMGPPRVARDAGAGGTWPGWLIPVTEHRGWRNRGELTHCNVLCCFKLTTAPEYWERLVFVKCIYKLISSF